MKALVAAWSCAFVLVLVGCSGDGNQVVGDISSPVSAGEGSTTTSSTIAPPTDAEGVAPTSAATVPERERPPAATKQELARRLDRLDFPQLRQSVEDGQDWNGQLVGWLFNNLTEPDIWLLCDSIDESDPPGCGTGVELTKEPAILTQQPEQFETLTIDGLPAVVMSRSFVAVTGTFLHDSAMFVPTEST